MCSHPTCHRSDPIQPPLAPRSGVKRVRQKLIVFQSAAPLCDHPCTLRQPCFTVTLSVQQIQLITSQFSSVKEPQQVSLEEGGNSLIRRHQQLAHHSDIYFWKLRRVIGFAPHNQGLLYTGTGSRRKAVFHFCSLPLIRAPKSPVPLIGKKGPCRSLFIPFQQFMSALISLLWSATNPHVAFFEALNFFSHFSEPPRVGNKGKEMYTMGRYYRCRE